MPFEHRSDPVLPFDLWLWRIMKSIGVAAIVAGISLSIGVLGYHQLGHLPWLDSILEASMILGGMGPVATMANDSVKLFASAYALFSGLFLIGTMGILLAPWVHRMLHKFHNEETSSKKRQR